MVSAVEQMAANTSWAALGRATDLRNRILFTLGLLVVYRLGTFIPVPGIDGAALQEFMEQAQQGIGGMLSMFTGGALGRIVEHLIDAAPLAAGRGDGVVHILGVEIADAVAADLAVLGQLLEGFKSLFQELGAGPVQQIKVDMVAAEVLQTALGRLNGALARGIARQNLETR